MSLEFLCLLLSGYLFFGKGGPYFLFQVWLFSLVCIRGSEPVQKCCSDLKEITHVDFAENGEGDCIVLGQAGPFSALPEYLMVFQLLWMGLIDYFACIQ